MVNFKFPRKTLSVALLAFGALAAVAIPQTALASVDVYVEFGSPRQYYEPSRYVEPARHARHGHVWVPGYWDRRGHRQFWIEGAWVRDRHVQHHRQDRWEDRRYGWYQERGRWDRDGDGIPDYRDSRPYNPRRW